MHRLLLLFLLLSCPSMSAESVIDELEPGQGYILVALNIEAGYIPSRVTLSGDGFFSRLQFKNLAGYNNYWLVPAQAGTYTWDRVYLDKRNYLNIADNEFSIEVKEGVINYGGHLSLYTEMNAYRTQLLGGARTYFNNRSARAYEYLSINHKPLLDKYPLSYSGEYADHFFNYVTQLEQN